MRIDQRGKGNQIGNRVLKIRVGLMKVQRAYDLIGHGPADCEASTKYTAGSLNDGPEIRAEERALVTT